MENKGETMKIDFKKRMLVNGGIIAGTVAVAFGGLLYLSGDLRSHAAKLLNDRASIQAQTLAVEKFADLERDAPSAAQYQNAINTLIPDQYQLITFGQLLNGLGRTHGVTANFAFQGSPTTPAAGAIGTAPFSLNVQGPLNNVINFLQDLEVKSPAFLLSLNGFDLTNTNSGNANLSTQGNLYFQ